MNASNGPAQTRQQSATPLANALRSEIQAITEFLSTKGPKRALRVLKKITNDELFLLYFAKYIDDANGDEILIKCDTAYKGVVADGIAYNIFVNNSEISIALCVQQRAPSAPHVRKGSSTPSEKSDPPKNQSSSTQETCPRDVVQNDSADYQPNVQQRAPSAPRVRQKTGKFGFQCHGYKNGNCPHLHVKEDQPVDVNLAKTLEETRINDAKFFLSNCTDPSKLLCELDENCPGYRNNTCKRVHCERGLSDSVKDYLKSSEK